MGRKRFWSLNISLFIVKFKKLGFSAPLILQNTSLFEESKINAASVYT